MAVRKRTTATEKKWIRFMGEGLEPDKNNVFRSNFEKKKGISTKIVKVY
jgi:hypothetical protein